MEEMQRQDTDEGHAKGGAALPSPGSCPSDPHSQTTATGAQIRDVKRFFPALSPDYY